jgi:fructokinase
LKILSIGEILWDVIAGEEHLGGAPFNFAVHGARLGHESWLLSAVGDDERGRRARAETERLGVQTRYLGTSRQAETGIATVTNDENGLPTFEIVRPAAYDFLSPDDELLADSFDAICFGTLLQNFEPARRATLRVLSTFPKALRFYDVNLRAGHYELECVKDLLSRASVVKLNESEAAIISGVEAPPLREFCEIQSRLFGLEAMAVTRGPDGCAVLIHGEYAEAPGLRIEVADTVGAGDAFGAAFLHGLTQGWPAAQVASFANRVGALVATRPGATPDWTMEELDAFAPESK